jgi:RimJ/RimL family protein N-acetyltransferase
MLGPTLETDRLILRPPEIADLDGWAEMMADEETARFVGGVQPRAIVFRTMATMTGHWALLGYGMFSVIEKSSGRWIGPWQPEGWPGPDIGWGLSRPAWGKGYAAEGASAAIDWAFDHLGWIEVIHCCDPRNRNSIALALRLGSIRRGTAVLPPPFGTEIDIYGQSREAWRNRQRRAAGI